MRRSAAVLLFSVFSIGLSRGEAAPVSGRAYEISATAQSNAVQEFLADTLQVLGEYQVSGPVDPVFVHDLRSLVDVALTFIVDGLPSRYPPDTLPHWRDSVTLTQRLNADAYGTPRIICPDLAAQYAVLKLIDRKRFLVVNRNLIETPADSELVGYRGAILTVNLDGEWSRVQVQTIQQIRWLIWAQHLWGARLYKVFGDQDSDTALMRYSLAVSNYLHAIDLGQLDTPAPKAVDFGLPDSLDFYAEPPDYVIEGYQNYKDYLNRHRGITTDFAKGILAFIATDSLLEALKQNAPEKAWPNKEAPMLQEEYRKFFERGGDVRVMQTLTDVGFDTLKSGEYFFAVGLTGKIRFGRELLREEVQRIEAETGRKVPRANHAFLFPGEPVLTAGAFFIKRDSIPHLVEVNAQSGHYFYSNVSPTIREDIAVHSNEYLLTLGHFFRALDRLGISYDEILIRKM